MSQSESGDSRSYGEIPPLAPLLPRGSNDLRTVSPLLDRKAESMYEAKAGQGYSEIPPPALPIRRASGDFRPVSPLLDRRAESHFESMTGYSVLERKAEPSVEVCAGLCLFDNVRFIRQKLMLPFCFLRGRTLTGSCRSTLSFPGTLQSVCCRFCMFFPSVCVSLSSCYVFVVLQRIESFRYSETPPHRDQ